MSYIPLQDLSGVPESSAQPGSNSLLYPSDNGEFGSDASGQIAHGTATDAEIDLNDGLDQEPAFPDFDGDESEEFISEEEHLTLIKTFRVYIWLLACSLIVQLLVCVLSILYWTLQKNPAQQRVYFVAGCVINIFAAAYLFAQHYYILKPWIGGRTVFTIGSLCFVLTFIANAVLSVASNARIVNVFLIFAIVLAEIGFYVILRIPNGKKVKGSYFLW